MCYEQLELPFPDQTVSQLISPFIDITRYEGLPAAVAEATREQILAALELLPDELRRGRGPVLEYALTRKAGTQYGSAPER
jgi:hypothetical protein